eukprot:10908113-Lingulodinium_polyedra.AAC.1
MQCNAMQCKARQGKAMQCKARQCNAMQCNAMQCSRPFWVKVRGSCQCFVGSCTPPWPEGALRTEPDP